MWAAMFETARCGGWSQTGWLVQISELVPHPAALVFNTLFSIFSVFFFSPNLLYRGGERRKLRGTPQTNTYEHLLRLRQLHNWDWDLSSMFVCMCVCAKSWRLKLVCIEYQFIVSVWISYNVDIIWQLVIGRRSFIGNPWPLSGLVEVLHRL